MSLVGYEYDDTTNKRKKDKPKMIKRPSMSLVEYTLPEDTDPMMDGQDGEIIIENHSMEEDDDSKDESNLTDSEDDTVKVSEQSIRTPDYSLLKTSSDLSLIKTASDLSYLSTSDFQIPSEENNSLKGETSPSKRQKTSCIDYSQWKNDYEGPMEPPCPNLVNKVIEYIGFKSTGANINREYRRQKEFKNPHILEKLVEYYHIDQTGSNYPKDKFDPLKWKSSDYYEVLAQSQEQQKNSTEKEPTHTSSSKLTSSSKGHHHSKSRSRDDKHSREKRSGQSLWDVGPDKDIV